MRTIKPRALRDGDTIGLVSTSSPVPAYVLERALDYLHGRGYRTRLAAGVSEDFGYLGGTTERRAAGLAHAIADPEIALILPIGGGTGAWHLVDRIDYARLRERAPIFTGFSNPTVLNNAILGAAGLATLHSSTGWNFGKEEVDPSTAQGFWAAVTGSIAGTEIAGPAWRIPRGGGRGAGATVSGPVVGGNLAAFGTIAGTRWMPDLTGAVLLLEAMTATYEQIDVALSHLRLLGVFDRIAALVVGEPADWPAENAPDEGVDELILRCVGGDFPVVTNVPYGHRPDRIAFPIGCRVEFRLDPEAPGLRYLEDFVTPA